MFDLAISPDGDLIFAGNRDLQGISSYNLIEQRIRLRCKLHRGSWLYDEDGTLGSEIWTALRGNFEDAQIKIPVFVRQALAAMTEIDIIDITVTLDSPTSVLVTVFYIDANASNLNISEEPDVLAAQIVLQVGQN